MTTKRAAVRELAAWLEAEKLTPLDLLSWTALLWLEASTHEFSFDLDLHAEMRRQIIEALRRKAEMLDEENATDFHRDMIKELSP